MTKQELFERQQRQLLMRAENILDKIVDVAQQQGSVISAVSERLAGKDQGNTVIPLSTFPCPPDTRVSEAGRILTPNPPTTLDVGVIERERNPVAYNIQPSVFLRFRQGETHIDFAIKGGDFTQAHNRPAAPSAPIPLTRLPLGRLSIRTVSVSEIRPPLNPQEKSLLEDLVSILG